MSTVSGSTPHSTSTQPDLPAPATTAAPATFAPAHDLSAKALAGFFKRAGTLPRLMLLACGGLVCLCFFTPEFYASLSVKDTDIPPEMRNAFHQSWFLFGWSTWWGILSFLLAFLTTIAVAGDLLLAGVKGVRAGLRLLYPAVYGLLTLTTGLGFLLALFGVDLGASGHYHPDGPAPSDYSLFRFPIMALPLLLLTVVALALSGWTLWKELQKGSDTATLMTPATPAGQSPVSPS